MRFSIPKLFVLFALLAVFGCSSLGAKKKVEKNNLLFTDKDIDKIFKAYQKDADKARKRRRAQISQRIRRLSIIRPKGKKEFLISADLDKAQLNNVIDAITFLK